MPPNRHIYIYIFRPGPTNTILPTPKWIDGANNGDVVEFVFGMDDELFKMVEKLVGR